MQNLIQLLNSLKTIIVASLIFFVVWSGPNISANKVDAWGFKTDHIELTFTRHTSDKPAQTSKPTAHQKKHKARKHP
jgi:hypothetical protein